MLYASGGDVSLSEVTLSGSRADEGGALWLDAPGLAELTDVTLEDNIADGDGGAVWQRNGSLTVSGGSASTNEAGGSGGAFFLDEVEADFTSWSTSTNSALTGGAVHAEGAMLTLDTVAFSSDSAISSGGAIYLDDADASFTDTSFTGHSAPVAGAVEMRAGSLTLSGLEASNNTASTGHGGFLKSSNGATLEIDNATFSDNAADSGGGDVSVASSTLMLSESTSSGASGETGAAVQLSYADAVFDEVTLSDCQYPKGKFDGCVALLDSDASMTALTLEDVAGAGKGAGLYASDSTLDIAGSTFSALSADNGGAIYQDDGVLTLTDTSFESCSADGWGGALHLSDATATMSEVVLDANEATDNGGAIYGSGTTLVLDSVQVTDNQASGEGGGLLLNELTTLAWTSEGTLASQLSGNTAESGGGLYAESIEFVSLEDLEVSDNTATSGGGLYIVQTDTLLQDVSFEDNTADAGGAIGLVLGAPLEVVGFNTTFSDNADDDIAYVQSGESYDDADEDLSSFVCDHERCE